MHSISAAGFLSETDIDLAEEGDSNREGYITCTTYVARYVVEVFGSKSRTMR